MASRRRIIPDNSVIVPAFFRETMPLSGNDFDLTARARPLVDAVRLGTVEALAPDVLTAEFFHVAFRKAKTRGEVAIISVEELRDIYAKFLSLRITPVPLLEVAAVAADLVLSVGIAPEDSWYVATAMHADAELWISHEHSDGLVEKAKSVHDKVLTLTRHRF